MKELNTSEKENIIAVLEKRFKENMSRHANIKWQDVHEKLSSTNKLWSINQMEMTGGEPDVVGYDSNEYIFFDCSKETPISRRNICYDNEALEARKSFKPENSAINMANDMGIELLTVEDYNYLQTIGDFDLKTSSWLQTPSNIRKLGGAIFGDKRYQTTFIYHNGAESYYGVRGFRGKIKI